MSSENGNIKILLTLFGVSCVGGVVCASASFVGMNSWQDAFSAGSYHLWLAFASFLFACIGCFSFKGLKKIGREEEKTQNSKQLKHLNSNNLEKVKTFNLVKTGEPEGEPEGEPSIITEQQPTNYPSNR